MKTINDFLKFINASPTPYHCACSVKQLLTDAGAEEISLSDINSRLTPGKLYCTQLSKSAVVSFAAGNSLENGLKLAAAHMDYPVLKVKPSGSRVDCGIERVTVEGYGGLVNHTWIDRPLRLAGLVMYEDCGNINSVLVNSDKTFVIPGVAIHQMREINDNAKFSIQNDMLPFLGLGSRKDEVSGFIKYVAKMAAKSSGKKLSPKDILSFDLSFYDAAPAALSGAEDEFISAPGLDDRAMAHALARGFADSCKESANGTESITPKLALFVDSEEIGSQTFSGARSALFTAVIKSVAAAALGKDTISDAEFYSCMQKSFALSCDMAHATHPAAISRSDPNLIVKLGGGPVLKTAWGQSYSTSAEGSAVFSHLCAANGIPFQNFTNNSDARGGSTIGPMFASSLGIVSIDIGNPTLSMHSARELAAVSDHLNMIKLFTAFFK